MVKVEVTCRDCVGKSRFYEFKPSSQKINTSIFSLRYYTNCTFSRLTIENRSLSVKGIPVIVNLCMQYFHYFSVLFVL